MDGNRSIKRLMAGTTGKWCDESVPKRDWKCVGVDDLEIASHLCEMCEAHIVRFVHTMAHADYGVLAVGCICAGHMEGDLDSAHRREGALKRGSPIELPEFVPSKSKLSGNCHCGLPGIWWTARGWYCREHMGEIVAGKNDQSPRS